MPTNTLRMPDFSTLTEVSCSRTAPSDTTTTTGTSSAAPAVTEPAWALLRNALRWRSLRIRMLTALLGCRADEVCCASQRCARFGSVRSALASYPSAAESCRRWKDIARHTTTTTKTTAERNCAHQQESSHVCGMSLCSLHAALCAHTNS